jgi:phosphopantetheinyl transferase
MATAMEVEIEIGIDIVSLRPQRRTAADFRSAA